MKKRAWYVISVLVLAPQLSVAQHAVELKEIQTVTIPGVAAGQGFLEPIKCDSDSRVYFRTLREPDPRNNPVTRVSMQGNFAVFPQREPAKHTPGIIDFAPTTDGGVALLTVDDASNHEFEIFDATGRLKSKSALPANLDPLQIAVSSSGNVLVSGMYSSNDRVGGASEVRPFVGIFEVGGRFEQLTLADDVRPGEVGTNVREALTHSYAESSDDGGFLLARLMSGGPIHLISSTGVDLDGGFRVSLPDGAFLSSVKMDGNTIAAMSLRKKMPNTDNEISDAFVSLWDSQTHEQLGEYHHSSPELGAAFACYKAGVFTFLSSGPHDEVLLVRATAEFRR